MVILILDLRYCVNLAQLWLFYFLRFLFLLCFGIRSHMLERENNAVLAVTWWRQWIFEKKSLVFQWSQNPQIGVSQTPCMRPRWIKMRNLPFRVLFWHRLYGLGLRIGDGFCLWSESLDLSEFHFSRGLRICSLGPFSLWSPVPPPAWAIQNTSYYFGSFLSEAHSCSQPDLIPETVL